MLSPTTFPCMLPARTALLDGGIIRVGSFGSYFYSGACRTHTHLHTRGLRLRCAPPRFCRGSGSLLLFTLSAARTHRIRAHIAARAFPHHTAPPQLPAATCLLIPSTSAARAARAATTLYQRSAPHASWRFLYSRARAARAL